MAFAKCPGQDTRYWSHEDIFEDNCPDCGSVVEFWKTDLRVMCGICGRMLVNRKFNLGCAEWCAYADQCINDSSKNLKTGSIRSKIEARINFLLSSKEIVRLQEAVDNELSAGEDRADLPVIIADLYFGYLAEKLNGEDAVSIINDMMDAGELPVKLGGDLIERICKKQKEGKKMSEIIKRDIVKIDEDLCDGCGLCVPACAEGAIRIIDGKARLVSEIFCDGLGACLGECPQGAISIEQREVAPFDEKAVEEYQRCIQSREIETHHSHAGESVCCAARELPRNELAAASGEETEKIPSELSNWPVQISLIPPEASFLRNENILIAADCLPFAYANFHRVLLAGRALMIGCPKLDDHSSYLAKMTAIFKKHKFKVVTVAIMEVPCCQGLLKLIEQAASDAGADFRIEVVVAGIDGNLK